MPAVVQTPGSPGERGAEHWLKSAGERGGRGTAGRGGPFCNLAGAPSSISSENRSEGSSLTHQPGAFSPQPSSPRTHRVERWVGRYGGGGGGLASFREGARIHTWDSAYLGHRPPDKCPSP